MYNTNTYAGNKKCIKTFWIHLKGRGHFGDLDTHNRTILKYIMKSGM
jgi:hypothetical protein